MANVRYIPQYEYTDSQVIEVNSRFIATGTSENFTINVPFPIFHNRTPRFAKVLDARIPYAWFNITALNNIFHFTDPITGVQTITLPVQNYRGGTLASTIKTLMDAVGSQVYSVSISPSTLLMTISAIAPFSLDFTMANSAYDVMGFANAVIPASITQIGTSMVDLVQEEFLWICSDLIRGIDNGMVLYNNVNPPISRYVFASVPINVDFGEFIEYAESYLEPVKNIESTTFAVKDNNGKVINFWLERSSGMPMTLGGLDWSMKFILFF
jgi:hypothetical protein